MLTFALIALAGARAQSPASDVASVKSSPPSHADRIDIDLGTFRNGVVTLTNATLSECVRPSSVVRGRFFHDHRNMHSFALLLSRVLRQPVLDLTGLTGFYDINFEWAPDDPTGASAAESSPLPDIYRAVEEQLGLHLESKKTPIEIIVIDRADRVPVAN